MTRFYFVVFCADDSDTLTVIDLDKCVDYERSDWNCIDKTNFTERDDAITYARDIAKENNLKYRPFTSRYDSELNEPKLTLTPLAVAIAAS